jgi:DNA polymerase-1
MLKRLLIVDCSALFHRSRSALTRAMGEMVTSSGVPVTGTYGFLNALFAVMAKYEYSCIIPCAEGGNNWRKRESDDYKANRDSASVAHYADQSLLLEEVLPTLGMNVAKVVGFEADDVIAHISRNSPAYEEIHILSCDKDLLQLVTNRVKVLLFSSAKKMELVDIDGVIRHFGVYPSEVKYFKALSGDKSDNVAGLPKVGPKTAVKIIEESRPKGEDDFLSGADRIAFHPRVKEQASTFYANLRLTTLENDVPDLAWFASSVPIPLHVEALFEGLEFASMLKRKGKILEVLGCDK